MLDASSPPLKPFDVTTPIKAPFHAPLFTKSMLDLDGTYSTFPSETHFHTASSTEFNHDPEWIPFSAPLEAPPNAMSFTELTYGADGPDHFQSSHKSAWLLQDQSTSASCQSRNCDTSIQYGSPNRLQELPPIVSRPISSKDEMRNTALIPAKGSASISLGSPQDGSSKHIARITKASYTRGYTRPCHPKLYCDRCNKHPKGFRGDHELRRHFKSSHAASRSVWICVDASQDKNVLSKCKSCRNKKQYKEYYNAAAHLRRVHFHPRKQGRKSRRDTQRWRGMGGGSDPPMEVLKRWMMEVEIVVDETKK